MPLHFYPMFTLYLVPTPLGDPDDITLRALRILREVSAIAADNLTAAQMLLDHYQISTPIIEYDAAFDMLASGDVALIAASGTPGIGGAAHEIVIEAIARGIRVEALPGASAEVTALVLSGLSTEAFVYIGALPDDLSRYAHERETMIFVVNDITEPVGRLLQVFGDRRVCIARFMPTESIYRGTLADAIHNEYTRSEDGEWIVIVDGAKISIVVAWEESRVQSALRERLQAGDPLKQAAKEIAAAAGWDRRVVYALGIEIKKNL